MKGSPMMIIPGALLHVRHGEWSRRDASDIDGSSQQAARAGRVSQSALWRTRMISRLWRYSKKIPLLITPRYSSAVLVLEQW
jgi:hypothetical protein